MQSRLIFVSHEVRSELGRAIIGWGGAGGSRGPSSHWNWRTGERRDRVGSWGAIWWIRRLSWDGGQKHNVCGVQSCDTITKYFENKIESRKYNEHMSKLVTFFP